MHPRIEELTARLPVLAECAGDMEDAFSLIRETLEGGSTFYLCGNGGSAADCEHWAGELLKGFCHPRPIRADMRETLSSELVEGLQGGLRCVPLTGFPSLSSAFANDMSPHLIFAQLVWALGRTGDLLAALSTSGNSRNVCLALETAKAKGMRTLALTGEDGGRVRDLADCCIRVPETATHLAQELHVPVYHCLSLMLEDAFFDHDRAG